MCACTSSSSPSASEPRAKPQYFQTRKKNTLFGRSVFWSSVGAFIFLVIIIYSRHIDNAPTQTLQGIIHFVRSDVAVPQIVQTTGQSPESHNSMSMEGGIKSFFLIFRIFPVGTKCVLAGLTAQDRRNLGHLNLQLLKATILGQQLHSMSNYLYSPAAAHFPPSPL